MTREVQIESRGQFDSSRSIELISRPAYNKYMRQLPHPDVDTIAVTDVLRALADPVRLDIVRQLFFSQDALTCSQLEHDRAKSSMSHHYKVLREAGIIRTHIAGKERFNLLRKSELNDRFPGLLTSVLHEAERPA